MSIGAMVLESVRSCGLIEPKRRVLALMSGGADSVCLVHALAALLDDEALVALHVNHGLRSAADEDERFCAALCARLGVAFEAARVEVPQEGNLEAAGREARYRAAEQARARLGLDRIATGHTASDQVETALYRLVCSPGRRALLGIAAESGRLIRPLLALGRDQTRLYCEAEGLPWREDETNLDRRFARNRIRLEVLPALRELHPAAEENVLATIDELREEADLLDDLVADATEQVVASGGTPALDVARLADLPRPLRRLMLRRLAEEVAGRPLALTSARVKEIERLALRGGSGALDLGAGVRAVCEYGVLRLQRRLDPPEPPPALLTVPGRCRFGDWDLSCVVEPGDGHAAESGSADEPLLDAGKLASELTVRAWQEGDRMRPLGLGGTKSLQDIFTDRKVPRSLRHDLPVVESDGEIAWVAGVALSDRFRVGARTERVVRLRARAGAAIRTRYPAAR
jgi:tRNA(Ile)-lysidine synthase